MKIFNWNEFKGIRNKIAIHCRTEEEAKNFCRMMHEHGMKWCNGTSYLKNNEFKIYKTRTCYSNRGAYSPYEYYQRNGYIIREYSDFFETDYIESVEEFIERTRRTL